MWSTRTANLWILTGSIVLGLSVGAGVDAAIGHSETIAGLFGGGGLGMILLAMKNSPGSDG